MATFTVETNRIHPSPSGTKSKEMQVSVGFPPLSDKAAAESNTGVVDGAFVAPWHLPLP